MAKKYIFFFHINLSQTNESSTYSTDNTIYYTLRKYVSAVLFVQSITSHKLKSDKVWWATSSKSKNVDFCQFFGHNIWTTNAWWPSKGSKYANLA